MFRYLGLISKTSSGGIQEETWAMILGSQKKMSCPGMHGPELSTWNTMFRNPTGPSWFNENRQFNPTTDQVKGLRPHGCSLISQVPYVRFPSVIYSLLLPGFFQGTVNVLHVAGKATKATSGASETSVAMAIGSFGLTLHDVIKVESRGLPHQIQTDSNRFKHQKSVGDTGISANLIKAN